jgi:hypothetical protein
MLMFTLNIKPIAQRNRSSTWKAGRTFEKNHFPNIPEKTKAIPSKKNVRSTDNVSTSETSSPAAAAFKYIEPVIRPAATARKMVHRITFQACKQSPYHITNPNTRRAKKIPEPITAGFSHSGVSGELAEKKEVDAIGSKLFGYKMNYIYSIAYLYTIVKSFESPKICYK